MKKFIIGCISALVILWLYTMNPKLAVNVAGIELGIVFLIVSLKNIILNKIIIIFLCIARLIITITLIFTCLPKNLHPKLMLLPKLISLPTDGFSVSILMGVSTFFLTLYMYGPTIFEMTTYRVPDATVFSPTGDGGYRMREEQGGYVIAPKKEWLQIVLYAIGAVIAECIFIAIIYAIFKHFLPKAIVDICWYMVFGLTAPIILIIIKRKYRL